MIGVQNGPELILHDVCRICFRLPEINLEGGGISLIMKRVEEGKQEGGCSMIL